MIQEANGINFSPISGKSNFLCNKQCIPRDKFCMTDLPNSSPLPVMSKNSGFHPGKVMLISLGRFIHDVYTSFSVAPPAAAYRDYFFQVGYACCFE